MNHKERDIFERLKNGAVVSPDDPQAYRLREASYATKALLVKMNHSSDPEEIRQILGEITGHLIDGTTAVFTPMYINYGKNTKIGKNVFINFGCTILDLGGVIIEDHVLIAPNVSLLSEEHPLSPQERQSLVPKPVHIKRKVWLGANSTILPGVTVGENSVVAAGAVVTKDVPANVVVAGIPAKIIREL